MAEHSRQDVDTAVLDRIPLGPLMRAWCPVCGGLNRTIDIGVNPFLVGETFTYIGVVRYFDCGHVRSCEHLASRCVTVRYHLERGTLQPEHLAYLCQHRADDPCHDRFDEVEGR